MPSVHWLKNKFTYGYDSGDVLSLAPNFTRLKEEIVSGGSYRNIFFKAIVPYLQPDSTVLELGPGKGSWSRAILKYIPKGQLHTADFVDVGQWLKTEDYHGRLFCHKVADNSFSCCKNDSFDFFWSFGVLCHNSSGHIKEIFTNSLPKMKSGGIAVHQYGDWEKLDAYGWKRGRVPIEFKDKPDEEIWWPRNSQEQMSSLARQTGWTVLKADLNLLKRDSMIVLKKNQPK